MAISQRYKRFLTLSIWWLLRRSEIAWNLKWQWLLESKTLSSYGVYSSSSRISGKTRLYSLTGSIEWERRALNSQTSMVKLSIKSMNSLFSQSKRSASCSRTSWATPTKLKQTSFPLRLLMSSRSILPKSMLQIRTYTKLKKESLKFEISRRL